MADLGFRYIHTNALKTLTRHSSGDKTAVTGGIDATLATGSAELDLTGNWNGEQTTDYQLRCKATSNSAQPMATEPVAGGNNAGSGTIAVVVGDDNVRAETWEAVCISPGYSTTKAVGQSNDYTELSAQGYNAGVRLEAQASGEGGNDITVEIGESTEDTFTWTDTGLTVATTVPAATGAGVAGHLFFVASATPSGILARDDIICFDSSDPSSGTGVAGAYRVCNFHAYTVQCDRSARAQITSGLKVYKLSSNSSFQVVVADASLGTTNTFQRKTDGVVRIRTIEHILQVIRDGGTKYSGASWVAQASTLVRWAAETSGNYAPELQTGGSAIQLSGGATVDSEATYARFRITGSTSGSFEVDADGAAHTIFNGEDGELSITITEGDALFGDGDSFSWATCQAVFEVSTDNGVTFTGSYNAAPAGTAIIDGLTMGWTIGTDTTPWVVGDVWRWRYDWEHSSYLLTDGDRNTTWRTDVDTYPHACCWDSGYGITTTLDGVWVLDHNISASGKLELHGSDTQPFFAVNTISGVTVTADSYSCLADEWIGGTITVSSGAARGQQAAITDNTDAGVFTLDTDLEALGLAAGDRCVMVHPSPALTVTLVGTGVNVAGDEFTGAAYRFWSLVMHDPAGGTSYSEASTIIAGIISQPTNGVDYRDDNPTYLPPGPEIHEGTSGRRRVLRVGTARTRLIHTYTAIDSSDELTLEQIRDSAWSAANNTLEPTLVVSPDDDDDVYLCHLISAEPWALAYHGAWSVTMTFESIEQAQTEEV